jgi:hypothetical protein
MTTAETAMPPARLCRLLCVLSTKPVKRDAICNTLGLEPSDLRAMVRELGEWGLGFIKTYTTLAVDSVSWPAVQKVCETYCRDTGGDGE